MSIKYINNKLHIENIAVKELVKKYPTPFYVYSTKQIASNLQNFKNAISCVNGKVFYSVKANSNLSVLNYINKLNCGFDIVSIGELLKLKKINCPAHNIVFSGVGKTTEELKEAILYGIKSINIESSEELSEIIELCNKLNKKANIMVRVNPDIAVNTHYKISTGKQGDKFGVSLEKLTEVCQKAAQAKNINLVGIACHIGSQIFDTESFKKSYTKVLNTLTELENKGINLKTLDLGGGFGVPYRKDEELFNFNSFSKMLAEVFANTKYELCFEPGRIIVANSGLLVTETTRVKQQDNKTFIILDSSMADLIRPSLYDSYHLIQKVENNTSLKTIVADIVGSICETGDTFHKNYTIEETTKGDLLAFFNCGAYCSSMSSNYNTKLLTKEILILDNKSYLVRNQSYNNFFELETIVE